MRIKNGRFFDGSRLESNYKVLFVSVKLVFIYIGYGFLKLILKFMWLDVFEVSRGFVIVV